MLAIIYYSLYGFFIMEKSSQVAYLSTLREGEYFRFTDSMIWCRYIGSIGHWHEYKRFYERTILRSSTYKDRRVIRYIVPL